MTFYDWIRQRNLSKSQITVILTGFYIFFALTANIAATKVTYFGSLIMDAGIIYCLTFTWRDLIHKQLGKSVALTTIWVAGIANLLAALYFQGVVLLPAETEWAAAGGQVAWEFLFSIQIRIVIGSVIAMIIAELCDTWTYQLWTQGPGKDKPQFLRVFVSNAVSIPIDSIIFPIIAFGGILSMDVIWQMFLANIFIKALFTVAAFWMIYLVPEKPLYTRKD
ncbi:queuosine precursor transporter [Candidatus Woesearchaeota archaeon]|nr:queuosine precursor transporter [Candidatus Woesearchaeota archaeon]